MTSDELRFQDTGTYTFVEAYTDGDGTADMTIGFTGNLTFEAGDFVL